MEFRAYSQLAGYSPAFPTPASGPQSDRYARPQSPFAQGGQASPSSPSSFPSPSPLATGITKPATYRTIAQWVTYSKESTAEFRRIGSSSPFVWLFVEGHDIPANAMVAGDDRGRPLYIARAFYEGSLLPGKAGRHLRLGAAIPFNGREIDISRFEVLVEATAPLRWGIRETSLDVTTSLEGLNISPQAQKPKLERLSLIKTVVVVDDSASMYGQLWSDTRNALAGVADINAKFSSDGLDIFFLNDPRFRINLRDQRAVRDLFDEVVPEGETPIGYKLKEVLDTYIPRLEDRNITHKPISIIVITDGVPTDDPAEVIIEAARRLDNNNVPQRRLGIQFVQIGDDPGASEALKELDDGLSYVHGIRVSISRSYCKVLSIDDRYGMKDIVDTTLFNPNDPYFKVETLIKILMGAIDHTLDNAEI
ncbi:hypothetical protein EWM64_g7031 [Hericium alpestre]|uniref:VWFA domain-containing protein n=1 Tax=Hericium alpestre TaxID=135208 RepID=A0A4Y9ZSG9_9AGAM|nr:hypothetical protein EWM64_g7031 [Hericium alpestre]